VERAVAIGAAVVLIITGAVVDARGGGTLATAGAVLTAEEPSAPALLAAIDRGARALAVADRGPQVQLTEPPPTPQRCERVAMIGDSLTANGLWWHQREFQRAGFTHRIDAQPSRRIPATVRSPYSGVIAATNVRTSWGEADCWVIALGSNDLIYGGGQAAMAAAMIDEQISAITPAARVWWVNVDYHHDPRTTFDFVRATNVFNAAIALRASTDPRLDVIDWYAMAEANLQWFFDPVHVDNAGSIARAALVASSLPR
jgi:hypothetical protein